MPSLANASKEPWSTPARPIQGQGASSGSTSGDDQCLTFGTGASTSSSCSPSLTVGSESPSDLGIVEFVPGKKWIEPKVRLLYARYMM